MLGHKNKSVVVTQCPPEAQILLETNGRFMGISEPGKKCIFSIFAHVASKCPKIIKQFP